MTRVINVRKDEKEQEVVLSKSERYKNFEAIIKAYKKQNPKKYEMKKEALKEQLKNIK